MQSRFAGSWCGWRRTLVRVASGVVCVDLCHVISLSSLYTALSILLTFIPTGIVVFNQLGT